MRCFPVLILLLFPFLNANALLKASSQESAIIEETIRFAEEKEAARIITKSRLDGARDPSAIAKFRMIADELEKERNDAYERAIWQTIRAYDILPFDQHGQPILPHGISVLSSPERGKPIAWVPVFEDIGIKSQQDERGRPAAIRIVGADVLGNTASDGVSRIHPGAFTSPAELALIINHEYRHFKQHTTRDEADVKTPAELEVAAYEEEKRLVDQNVLGFTSEAKDYQQARLKEMISKKTALAAKERAAADRNGGRIQAGDSYPSHPQVSIDSLIEKARAQVAISNRDHDERLLGTLADIVWRTCQIPGSVGQDELDRLQFPRDPNFGVGRNVGLVGDCLDLFSTQAGFLRLGIGLSASNLRTGMIKPAPAPPATPPIRRALPVPPAVKPIQPTPKTPFSDLLPSLQRLAVTACQSPGNISTRALARDSMYIRFSLTDGEIVNRLAAGLGSCERAVFDRLVGLVRAGKGPTIDDQWLRDLAAANRAPPVLIPPAKDPACCTPQDDGSRPCRYCGPL